MTVRVKTERLSALLWILHRAGGLCLMGQRPISIAISCTKNLLTKLLHEVILWTHLPADARNLQNFREDSFNWEGMKIKP